MLRETNMILRGGEMMRMPAGNNCFVIQFETIRFSEQPGIGEVMVEKRAWVLS